MTKWLASIQSVDEAQIILSSLPTILDMKNPQEGALGAMPIDQISDIVALVGEECLTSATIGDLPMRSDLIAARIKIVAATGVDYVKIGIFPSDDLDTCIDALAATVKQLKTPVIAVVFADSYPNQNIIPLLKQSGFAGVMIDTAIKNGKALPDLWSQQQISEFVTQAKQQDLLCGLAGALRLDDIDLLKQFGADYLGFRSALCADAKRKRSISSALVHNLRKKFI